jgi:hypothetical protein
LLSIIEDQISSRKLGRPSAQVVHPRYFAVARIALEIISVLAKECAMTEGNTHHLVFPHPEARKPELLNQIVKMLVYCFLERVTIR